INGGVRLVIAQLTPRSDTLKAKFDPNPTELATAVAASPKTDPEVMRSKLRADNISTWWAERWYMNLIGLVVAIIAVYTAGRLLGGFLGRKIYVYVERLITSLPVFKQVYPYVKQFVDFLLGENKQIKFNHVVLVQYPRKGVWSIGFQTGAAMRSI